MGRKGSRDDWRNVTEHCALEAARVGVLGDMLGLSPEICADLRTAAWLHDAGKRDEIMSGKGSNDLFGSYVESETRSRERLVAAGYSSRVIRLAGSMGHTTLLETEELLGREALGEEDIAFLAIHYIDDMAVDNKSVTPAEVTPEGVVINDLDRRMKKNEVNPNYRHLHETGRPEFRGEPAYRLQAEVGKRVEGRLFSYLQEREVPDLPQQAGFLPEFIEEQLQKRIYK